MAAIALVLAGPRWQNHGEFWDDLVVAAYYLVLVSSLLVAAIWLLSAATARGMLAVVTIVAATYLIPGPLVFRLHSAGIRIPNLLAMLAIGGPQLVFFGPEMFWVEPRHGFVLPPQWALLVTLAFWLVAALAFGWLARRLKSPTFILAAAVAFVVGTALAARTVAPLFNWQILMEFP